MKRKFIYISLIILAVLALPVAGTYLYTQYLIHTIGPVAGPVAGPLDGQQESHAGPVDGPVERRMAAPQGIETNAGSEYRQEEVMLEGEWLNGENGTEHFRFTLDDAEQGLHWGYTWDLAEDVSPEDLPLHGNGWFRWHLQGKRLILLHQTVMGIEIPHVIRLNEFDEEHFSYRNLRHQRESYQRNYQGINE